MRRKILLHILRRNTQFSNGDEIGSIRVFRALLHVSRQSASSTHLQSDMATASVESPSEWTSHFKEIGRFLGTGMAVWNLQSWLY